MSVIIRLQNLPWSANALDIRNFFRGLSIPEGGVHIVGGELGDAFIAFSTDEDARQGMMLNGGKIKEIQVKLLLSSRSEMHKVIETARQSVPIMALTASPTPTPAPAPIIPPAPAPPTITPFSAALGTNPLSSFSIPGIGNPQEIPQPAVIEFPPPMVSSPTNAPSPEEDRDEEKPERMRRTEKDRRRSRSHSRSRDRERKDRKRERRDRSRSREGRRRRDRSRSRDRRDRKRDRKDRSRSRDRSPSRRSRDKRTERKSPQNLSQERSLDGTSDISVPMIPSKFPNKMLPSNLMPPAPTTQMSMMHNGPPPAGNQTEGRFSDPTLADTFNKLQELGKKRNPNAFQGDHQNGGRFSGNRGGAGFRRERTSRFDEPQRDCCVAIRNAPNHTSYGDVRRFFPFMIDKHGIKMINDNMGRRTGNIYVRFCDTRSKQLSLQRKGNELKGAQVIVEDLDDDSYESAVDSFLPFREENDDDDPNLIIAEMEENVQPNSPFLKLSDLPNYVKELDIIKTFSDFSLLSITIKNCRTTRSKVAIVHFVKAEDAKKVLERKDKYIFGRRHPTIVGITKDEFDAEKSSGTEKEVLMDELEQAQEAPPPRDPRQRRLQMESAMSQPPPMVPASSAPPLSMPPPSLKVGPPIPNQGPPPPFFGNQFPVQPQFGTPYPSPQFGTFPTRPSVPAIPRPTGNNWQPRPGFSNHEKLPPRQMANPHVHTVDMDEEPMDCVLIKGLPRGANDRSIVTFLSDTGAVPARIHIMLDANGAPSGECYCEFRSVHEANQAAAKHGKKLEDCHLMISLVTKRVVEEALEGPKEPETMKRDSLLGSAPPPAYFEQPRGGFAPRGPYRGRGGFDRGGYNRGGFDQSRGGFDASRGDYNQARGAYRGRGNWSERGARGFERGRGRGYARGRGMAREMFENGREAPADEEQDPALEDFGAPGCVVSMENVPFRATIDDILIFFSEFDLSQDDVIRRYNERGQPTGDARVAFPTAFDAQRAVLTCNANSIHDRRIHLSVL